jgi:DNA-directed RNA polymerase subunit RPC12/RpoP
MTEPLKIIASVSYIECPHCEVPQFGFLNDPRGGTYDCNDCKLSFDVPDDTPVDLGS